jgi:hypothetical protein
MRSADLQKHVGDVVILDLVSGAQVTTRLKEITIDGFATVGKLMIFQVVPEPHNPMLPPHPETNPIEHKVKNGMYGFPLIETPDTTDLDVNHIVMAHPAQRDMEAVYQRVTSGIELAPAGALSALDAANQQRR